MKTRMIYLGIMMMALIMIVASCAQTGLTDAVVADTAQEDLALIEANEPLAGSRAGYGVNDPVEGVNPDLTRIAVYYYTSNVTIYIYFNNAQNLSWGTPYIYLYDQEQSHNDRDMIAFSNNTSYQIRRDRDANGHFETLVATGTNIVQYNNGSTYRVTIPRGHLPDISSRKIWAYCMGSRDRVPNTGYLTFNERLVTVATDAKEGVNPDFSELEVGADTETTYIELDYYNAVGSLSGGNPFIYLYDLTSNHERYMITFKSSNVYDIKMDIDANGHFETLVYTGSTAYKLDQGKRYSVIIPAGKIPNINNKKIWAYSMNSKDRVPNKGSYLTF